MSQYFRDAAHAASFIGGFFRDASTKEGFFAGSGVVIAYTLTDPDLRIVNDGTVEPKPGRAFGFYLNDPAAPAPTVEFFTDADTFHRLYRGEEQPMALVLSGKVKTKGDVTAAMRLLPAMAAASTLYKAYCEAHPLAQG